MGSVDFSDWPIAEAERPLLSWTGGAQRDFGIGNLDERWLYGHTGFRRSAAADSRSRPTAARWRI